MLKHTLSLVTFAAISLSAPILPTTALANYSCEPGQPNCVPMGQHGSGSGGEKERAIQCRVAGKPEALPDDLKFRNIGQVTIEAGTFVKWDLPHTGESGEFMIPTDLPPGAALSDLDALRAGFEPNTPCKVRFLNT